MGDAVKTKNDGISNEGPLRKNIGGKWGHDGTWTPALEARESCSNVKRHALGSKIWLLKIF